MIGDNFGTTFCKKKFSDQSTNYENCFFEGCDFSNSKVSSQFENCKFFKCNFSLTKLNKCRLQNVFFEECKFVGVQFFTCDKFLLFMNFKRCLIDSCNFSDMSLKKISFFESTIRRSDFNNTDLTESDFKKTNLEGTIFHHSNLSKANFLESINYSINPFTNNIQKAIFSKPEVYSLLNFLDIAIE